MTCDPKTLNEFIRGDRSAFAKLYAEFQNPVFRVAFSILGRQADAEDLTQDVFIQAYKKRDRFGPPYLAELWLKSICARLALERIRLNKARPFVQSMEENIAAVGTKDQNLIAEEHLGLWRALQTLPEEARLMIVLFEIDGIPQKEIADILNCSLEKVKTGLHRARKTLKEKLTAENT